MWHNIQRSRHLWLAVVTVGLVLTSIGTRSRVEHLNAQLARETKQANELRSKVELLQNQVQQYSSLREVAPRAMEDLGLRRADPDRIQVLHFTGPNRPTWVPEAYAGKKTGQ